MQIFSILVIFVLISVSTCSVIGNLSSQGLYFPEDDIIILTTDNFKYELYGRNRSILVEFYNAWCGYCQRYAPIWKSLAKDIKSWQDVVAVGAIDCANDLNAHACSEFGIIKYPMLRYFHPNYQESLNNYGTAVKLSLDPAEELKNLVRLLIKEQNEGRGEVFPNLQPYMLADMSNIFESESTKYGFLVSQDSSEYVGALLTMDFHTVNDIIIRYTFFNNSELFDTLNIPAENHLILINRGNNVEILSSGYLNTTICHNLIYQELLTKNVTMGNGGYIYAKGDDLNPQNKTISKGNFFDDTVFQIDLESTLRYSLKREVGGVREIGNEHLNAVRKYVNVLLQYFPFGKNGKILLKNITNYAFSSENISGLNIGKMILNADKPDQNVFSSSQGWIRCMGSEPKYRGYPCGMWTLFHYLSVNAAIDNQDKNFNNEILETMYFYIKNLFGCKDCSDHFVTRADKNGLFNVTSYDEAIIWLWRIHNNVNEDLAEDPTEDPHHPKIQFPSKINCPVCHNTDQSWNINEVLKYLKSIYSRRHLSYTDSNIEVLDVPADYLVKDTRSKSSDIAGRTLFMKMAGILLIMWHLYDV